MINGCLATSFHKLKMVLGANLKNVLSLGIKSSGIIFPASVSIYISMNFSHKIIKKLIAQKCFKKFKKIKNVKSTPNIFCSNNIEYLKHIYNKITNFGKS